MLLFKHLELLAGAALPAGDLNRMDKMNDPSLSWFRTLFFKPFWYLSALMHLMPFGISARHGVALPRIKKFFKALRDDPPAPDLRIGVAGFCWGGRYVVLLCGKEGAGADTPLVDAGFTAHPALVSIPHDIEAVQRPLSIANGENDEWMGKDKFAVLKSVLASKGDIHEVVVYDGAKHGFAVRGDPNDPRQAEMVLRAEDQAVKWFRKQLAGL